MAGLQIKGVSYYLRLKSLSVTCSYGHPRQGSGQRRIRVGNNSKTRGIRYPTAIRQSRPSVASHYYRERSTVVPSHLDIRSLRSTPNFQITLNPVHLVRLCCTTAIPEQARWPSLGGTLPAPGRTSSDDSVLPDTPRLQTATVHQMHQSHYSLCYSRSRSCSFISNLAATPALSIVLAHHRSCSTCSCALVVLVIRPCDGAVCQQL